VEVYRHEPGGWLAIRPPQGSFSWVSARQANVKDSPQVAEVAVDGAVAWVGSTESGIHQLKWQVRLQREELLEVLGQKSLSVGLGFATETHYQVAPPAGEFRWIHAQHASSPEAVAHRRSSQTIELTEYTSADAPIRRTLPDATTNSESEVSPSDLGQAIDQLQTDLSLMVTDSIERWDLNRLKARADQLVRSAAGTPRARDARAVSQRIVEFETVRRRHESSRERALAQEVAEDDTPENEPAGRRGRSPAAPRLLDEARVLDDDWEADIEAAVGTGVEQAAAETRVAGARFEAEGWLMPVHSTKRVAPPFALLDDQGRVQCYVTPVPGLNLRRYSKKYIGLLGERRHVESLRAAHITAERIVKLARPDF
jgi:hypothetical protein